MACDLLDPKPGEVVLDACAAPGGKAGYMAQKMENQGALVACDYDKLRLARLEQNLIRLGVSNSTIVLMDWLQHASPFKPETFDAILVDVPCTNTGVIRQTHRCQMAFDSARLSADAVSSRPNRQGNDSVPEVRWPARLQHLQHRTRRKRKSRRLYRSETSLSFASRKARSSMPIHDHLDGAFAALFVKA